MIKQQFLYVFRVVFRGAGRDIIKPKRKKGSIIRHWLDLLDYSVSKALDRLDTKILFDGKPVPTKRGRVRSRGERRLTAFFDKNGIVYVYEPELVLGKITLHPDFYLPKEEVYVEFWGMVDISAKYRGIMASKKKLYEEHRILLVSIYPRDLTKKLGRIFKCRFEEATGRSIVYVLERKET